MIVCVWTLLVSNRPGDFFPSFSFPWGLVVLKAHMSAIKPWLIAPVVHRLLSYAAVIFLRKPECANMLKKKKKFCTVKQLFVDFKSEVWYFVPLVAKKKNCFYLVTYFQTGFLNTSTVCNWLDKQINQISRTVLKSIQSTLTEYLYTLLSWNAFQVNKKISPYHCDWTMCIETIWCGCKTRWVRKWGTKWEPWCKQKQAQWGDPSAVLLIS